MINIIPYKSNCVTPHKCYLFKYWYVCVSSHTHQPMWMTYINTRNKLIRLLGKEINPLILLDYLSPNIHINIWVEIWQLSGGRKVANRSVKLGQSCRNINQCCCPGSDQESTWDSLLKRQIYERPCCFSYFDILFPRPRKKKQVSC